MGLLYACAGVGAASSEVSAADGSGSPRKGGAGTAVANSETGSATRRPLPFVLQGHGTGLTEVGAGGSFSGRYASNTGTQVDAEQRERNETSFHRAYTYFVSP